MFIVILGITIGLLGASASAGIAQLALSYGAKNALLHFIGCMCVFIPSMLIFLLSANDLFKNNVDFLIVLAISLVPVALIMNIGKEKALMLKTQNT